MRLGDVNLALVNLVWEEPIVPVLPAVLVVQGKVVQAVEEAAEMAVQVVNEIMTILGSERIRKVNKILLLSLWGAFGAGLSALLALVVFIFLEKVPVISQLLRIGMLWLLWVMIHGLCFIPLGAFIGLSVAYCIKALQDQRKKLILGCSIGGALYGVFNFFSLEGILVGLILFGIFLSGSIGIALCSKKGAAKTAFAFFINIVILYILLRYVGDIGFNIVMSFADPLRWIGVVGTYNIIWLILVFYFMNFSILAALWGEIGT